MALTRRRTRKITVERTTYRWLSRRTFERNPDTQLLYVRHRLFVELEEHPGRWMRVDFDSRELFPETARMKYADFLSITPSVMAAAIRHARANGWQPESDDIERNRLVVADGGAKFQCELTAAMKTSGPAKPGAHLWDD